MNLSNTLLFRGLQEKDIDSLLGCLNATKRSYKEKSFCPKAALQRT